MSRRNNAGEGPIARFDYGGAPIVAWIEGRPYTAAALERRRARMRAAGLPEDASEQAYHAAWCAALAQSEGNRREEPCQKIGH